METCQKTCDQDEVGCETTDFFAANADVLSARYDVCIVKWRTWEVNKGHRTGKNLKTSSTFASISTWPDLCVPMNCITVWSWRRFSLCRGILKGFHGVSIRFKNQCVKLVQEHLAPLSRVWLLGLEVVHYPVQEQRWNVWLLDKGQLCTEAPIVETSISSIVFKLTATLRNTMVGFGFKISNCL